MQSAQQTRGVHGGLARPAPGWTSRLPLACRPWLQRCPTAAYSTAPPQRPDIRNVAIVAHVDHGKTTLVAGMLQFARQAMERGQLSSLVPATGALSSSPPSAPLLDPGAGRMLDSAALERERGITILARNTSLRWRGVKLNVIDTPGHVDFGGEVERALCMADGVLLLVDAAEGPMPQTRGVLQRALRNDLPVVLVVNKVDRSGADPHAAAAATFDLFVDLGASDEQCEYATIFASGAQGRAGLDPGRMENDLQCLLDAVVQHLPGPRVEPDAPLQLLVADLDHDPHKGRIAVGRVIAGGLSRGDDVVHGGGVDEGGAGGEEGGSRRGASASLEAPAFVAESEQEGKEDGVDSDAPVPVATTFTPGRVAELMVYEDGTRRGTSAASAGDIVAVAGLSDICIGDTICAPGSPVALPPPKISPPTVRLTLAASDTALAGREGTLVTRSALGKRLARELDRNLALRVRPVPEGFELAGRGALHLGVLAETFRREGYAFALGPPRVVERRDLETGARLEPWEEITIEVEDQHVGAVTALLSQRRATMLDMSEAAAGGTTRLRYRAPTRAVLSLRSSLLHCSRGTATMSTELAGHEPWGGDLGAREQGSLVAVAEGQATAYAILGAEARGRLFVRPGDEIFEGQVVGIHQRAGDLGINVCKKKALTNMRAASKEQTVVLAEPIAVNLEYALEYIAEDELVEVTPKNVRIRKNPAFGRNKNK